MTTLIAALERLRQHQFEPRIVPAVAAYFKGIAPVAPPAWRERYANIATAIRTPGVLAELQRDDPRATRWSEHLLNHAPRRQREDQCRAA